MSFCPDVPGKHSWPELRGINGEAAAAVIERQNRRVKAIVLKDGSATTKDIRCDRVRVFVNDYGLVVHTPYIG